MSDSAKRHLLPPARPGEPSSGREEATTGGAHNGSASNNGTGTGTGDVVLLGPPTADGGGVHVLRARDERIEAGELRHLQEGRPITGEIVTLAPRKDNPRICDVKDSYAHRPPSPPKGPAQVASQAYRDNWDEVFASKPPPELN